MNQNILYTADLVVPISAAPITDGAIHVRDGRIVAVGSRQQLQADVEEGTESIDFGAAILMPPLVNAHTHLELTDFPLWLAKQPSAENQASPATFVDWILQMIQIKHSLEPEQLQQSILNGQKQLLQSGTGAVCDILSVTLLDTVYQQSPLFGWLCYELIGLDEGMGSVLPMMAKDWLQGADLMRLQRGLSPHAPYTIGPETLSALTELGARRRVLSSIHAAESPAETQFLDTSTGDIATKLYPLVGWQVPTPPLATDPARYLAAANALSPANILVHGVQFDAAAIHNIAKTNSTVVLCPRSNAKLGVGRAPVESYLCQSVHLALGTDSMASNDSLSLWDEMAFAREVYGSVLSPVQILAMATINGARALGLDVDLGDLSPGTGANFQILKPSELPQLEDLADFLCRGERGSEVAHLYLDNVDILPDML